MIQLDPSPALEKLGFQRLNELDLLIRILDWLYNRRQLSDLDLYMAELFETRAPLVHPNLGDHLRNFPIILSQDGVRRYSSLMSISPSDLSFRHRCVPELFDPARTEFLPFVGKLIPSGIYSVEKAIRCLREVGLKSELAIADLLDCTLEVARQGDTEVALAFASLVQRRSFIEHLEQMPWLKETTWVPSAGSGLRPPADLVSGFVEVAADASLPEGKFRLHPDFPLDLGAI